MLLHNTKKEFKKWRKLWTNLEENRLEPLREHGNDGKKVELHELQNEHNREVVQHNENETQSNELGNKGQSGELPNEQEFEVVEGSEDDNVQPQMVSMDVNQGSEDNNVIRRHKIVSKEVMGKMVRQRQHG